MTSAASVLAASVLVASSAGCESRKPPASATSAASTTPAAPTRAAEAASASAAPALPSAASPSEVQKQPCNVALLGDSLTDFASHGGGYVRYLERRCPSSHFMNLAKGGAMVNQIRRRFEETLASQPRGAFSHVVVFGGVNDLYSDETAGRTTTKIETDLTALYAGARALGARVVAITVAPWGGFTRYFTPHRADTTRELNTWILAQAADGSVDTAVDAFGLLSCGDPNLLCERYTRAKSDGLHFGQAGHEALGALLYEREFHACP
jgi:lysophospholipase L1-like esterase